MGLFFLIIGLFIPFIPLGVVLFYCFKLQNIYQNKNFKRETFKDVHIKDIKRYFFNYNDFAADFTNIKDKHIRNPREVYHRFKRLLVAIITYIFFAIPYMVIIIELISVIFSRPIFDIGIIVTQDNIKVLIGLLFTYFFFFWILYCKNLFEFIGLYKVSDSIDSFFMHFIHDKYFIRYILYIMVGYFFYGIALGLNRYPQGIAVSCSIIAILTIILIIMSVKNKSNIIGKMYIAKISILTALCMGMIPITTYATSFLFLESDYVFERYFSNYREVPDVIKSQIFIHTITDSGFFSYLSDEDVSSRELYKFIADNEVDFLKTLDRKEMLNLCNEHGINTHNIYDYFVLFNEFYVKFDVNFIVFGISLGFIIFMLYYVFYLKKKKLFLAFAALIIIITFIDTYFDGLLIYHILKLFNDRATDIQDYVSVIPQVQNMLVGLSVSVGVIAAIKDFYD